MKLQMLILDSDIKTRNILKKNVEDVFGADVLEAGTNEECHDILKENYLISIIIINTLVDRTQYASSVISYLYDCSLPIPVVIIGEYDHSLKKQVTIISKLRVEEINRVILKVLNLGREKFEYLKMPDYIAYPVTYFYMMKSAPTDIFLKLSKKDGDEFVKRFNDAEAISKKELSKYEDFGLKDFYISKDDNETFLNALLIESIAKIKDAPLENKVEVLNDSFVMGSDMLRKIGISKETKAIVDQTIIHMAAMVSKTDQLGLLLKNILDNEFSFSYRRSYLTSLLFVAILPKLDWVNGEQQNILLLKMTMVSYFHDIYLDKDEYLKVMSRESYLDFRKEHAGELAKDCTEIVANHANKAALLLQSYPKLPLGVDVIVKQHHGVSNGIGFPEVLSANISPLAIVFIVVEDFANQLVLKEKGSIKIEEIINRLEKKYTLPSYRKVVEILRDFSRKSKKVPK